MGESSGKFAVLSGIDRKVPSFESVLSILREVHTLVTKTPTYAFEFHTGRAHDNAEPNHAQGLVISGAAEKTLEMFRLSPFPHLISLLLSSWRWRKFSLSFLS